MASRSGFVIQLARGVGVGVVAGDDDGNCVPLAACVDVIDGVSPAVPVCDGLRVTVEATVDICGAGLSPAGAARRR